MIPGVGDAYSALTGFLGYDPIAGVALSDVERAAAIAGAAVLGGGFHLLSRVGDGVADATRLGQTVETGAAGAATRWLDAGVRYRPGKPIPREAGLDWALSAPVDRAYRVAEKYGIRLRAGGRPVTLRFDPSMTPARSGRVTGEHPTVIEFGPEALRSEEELARTIAHELRHSRAYLGSGSNNERAAQAAEEALAEYIQGKR